jgi:hypothetical protein
MPDASVHPDANWMTFEIKVGQFSAEMEDSWTDGNVLVLLLEPETGIFEPSSVLVQWPTKLPFSIAVKARELMMVTNWPYSDGGICSSEAILLLSYMPPR